MTTNRGPVWAQWVPLQGAMGREPTVVSLRRHPNKYFEIAVISSAGMHVLCERDAAGLVAFVCSTDGITHWLEGHPTPDQAEDGDAEGADF